MDTPGPRWLCPGRCWRRSWGRSVVCERRRARDEQLPRLNGSGVEPRRAEMVCRKVRVTYRRLGSLGPTRCSTGQPGREKGTSLHSASLTTKPPASSVYVHVPEAPPPLTRSISVTSPFSLPCGWTNSSDQAITSSAGNLWLRSTAAQSNRLS